MGTSIEFIDPVIIDDIVMPEGQLDSLINYMMGLMQGDDSVESEEHALARTQFVLDWPELVAKINERHGLR